MKQINFGKMKPFNLNTYKGETVCTREGKPARIICDNAQGSAPVIALVEGRTSYKDKEIIVETPYSYDETGNFHLDGSSSPLDLMIKPECGWINVYPDNTISHIHKTEESARNCRTGAAIATIYIEWYRN